MKIQAERDWKRGWKELLGASGLWDRSQRGKRVSTRVTTGGEVLAVLGKQSVSSSVGGSECGPKIIACLSIVQEVTRREHGLLGSPIRTQQ